MKVIREIESDSGLISLVFKEGKGEKPKKGQTIVAHYTGTLEDGTKFDSSRDRGQPFEFVVGTGRVIKGWDEAFLDMKAGEHRTLIIPPDLGYAGRAMGKIPAWSILNFEVVLMGIK